MEDNVKGSILGFAIGDALGAPLEFREDFKQINGFEPSYGKGLNEGQYTDDTQHMELSLDSCLGSGGKMDLEDQAKRLVNWYRSGNARSIGRTTDLAIKNLMMGVGPYKSGINNVNSCGSLGLARLLPYSLLSAMNDFPQKLKRADTRKILGVTHAHKFVLQMGELLNYFVQEVMYEKTPEETLDMLLFEDNFLNKRIRRKLRDVKDLKYSSENPYDAIQQLGNTGFVEDVMFSALYSTIKGKTFEDAVLYAANGGGDSDSRAAITGSLYGLDVGIQKIPFKWREKLERSSKLEKKAEELYTLGK